MSITDRQINFVTEIVTFLKKQGVRAKSDLRNEKIGFKIREHTLSCVPYLLVVGDREMEARTVAVRTQQGADLGSFTLDRFLELISEAVSRLGRTD